MTRQKRPPMKRAATAGALLGDLLTQWGMTGKLQAYRAWQVWDEVVGPQIAAHARPARIREGVLEVRVDQAVWMQQLQLLKPKLLARLNERLGEETIRDIFWRRGTHPAAPLEPVPAPPPQPPLPPEEISRIDEIVAPLTDPEVRAHLRRLLIRQARLDLGRRRS